MPTRSLRGARAFLGLLALPLNPLASQLGVDTRAPVATVDESFLSFAFDTAQVSGGKWWDGSVSSSAGRGAHPVPPFDFSPVRLRRLAQGLAPAYLRIGGSEADLVYYDLGSRPPGAPLPPGFESRITRERYDAAFRFAREAGLKLFFDLNAGPGNRGQGGGWNPDNALELLRYASESGQWPAAWEFGNEVNAYWLIQGLSHQISARRYSLDYATARQAIRATDPQARLAGPASAYWPWLGEPFGAFFGEMRGFLRDSPRGSVDVVSWHFYPTESRRCALAVRRASAERLADPETLNEARRWATQVRGLRDSYQPQAELWLGETGSAQCGGEPGASELFASSFWWLDELGTLARLGHSVVIRQTLTGSDYGMIREGDWEPRPDYWASLLWKKLMGRKVLAVANPGEGGRLRAYAHCAASAAPGGALTFLLINLESRQSRSVSLDGFGGRSWLEYAVSSAGGLRGTRARLGGVELVAGPQGELPDLLPSSHAALAGGLAPVIDVPPLSYVFVVIPDAHAAACEPAAFAGG